VLSNSNKDTKVVVENISTFQFGFKIANTRSQENMFTL